MRHNLHFVASNKLAELYRGNADLVWVVEYALVQALFQVALQLLHTFIGENLHRLVAERSLCCWVSNKGDAY